MPKRSAATGTGFCSRRAEAQFLPRLPPSALEDGGFLARYVEDTANSLARALDAAFDPMGGSPSQCDCLSRAQELLSRDVPKELAASSYPSALAEKMHAETTADTDAARQIAAAFMADVQDIQRRLDEVNAQIAKYTAAAENAIHTGSDEDAKRLLASREQVLARQRMLNEELGEAQHAAQFMQTVYRKLRQDLEILKSRSASGMKDRAAAVAEKARREAEERALLEKYSGRPSAEDALREIKNRLGM